MKKIDKLIKRYLLTEPMKALKRKEEKQLDELSDRVRYRHSEVLLSKREQRKWKSERIKELRDSLRFRQQEIAGITAELKTTIRQPAPTKEMRKIAIKRGEPGFEQCSPVFDFRRFMGDVSFVRVTCKHP